MGALSAVANSSGIASVTATASSPVGGPYNVTDSSAGLTSVNLSLTNTGGAAASMTAVGGSTPQSALVNAQFTKGLGGL